MVQAGGSKDEEELLLPKKIHNDRTYRNSDDNLQVIVNGFALNMSKLVKVVYKYELRFRGYLCSATTRAGKQLPEKFKELWRGDHNDVANRLRARLNYTLYQALIEREEFFHKWNPSYKKSFAHGFVYDCATILFSYEQLLKPGEKKVFNLPKDTVSDELLTYVGNPRLQHFEAELSGNERVDLSHLNVVGEDKNRTAIQFLELLYSQYVYQKDSHYVFADRMFEKERVIHLETEPRILKPGLSKNIRVIGDHHDECRFVIQVEQRKAAFFPHVPAHEFIKNLLAMIYPNRNIDLANLTGNDDGAENARGHVRKHLRGICFKTTHLANNRVVLFNGITDRSATDVTFPFGSDQEEITVYDYYERQYSKRLQFPKYPCIIEMTRKKDANSRFISSYYPLEVLELCDGQRVSFDKQTNKLTEQMIRNCQAKPSDLKRNTMDEKASALISNDNPYGRVFGVGVGHTMETAPAIVLHPPKIHYYDQQYFDLTSNDVGWNFKGGLDDRARYTLAVSVNIWAAIAYQPDMPLDQIDQFLDCYVRTANRVGINICKPQCTEVISNLEKIRPFFEYCQKHNAQFVMLITNDKVDSASHNLLKLMEVEYGIPTQHVCKKACVDTVMRQNRVMTINNIIMKTNLKLGGVNWNLTTSSAFFAANGGRHDVIAQDLLGPSRIFFGLDFSHPAAQSRFERKSGAPVTEPTVVALAYTLGMSLKMCGQYWYQEPRVTHVLNFQRHIVVALRKYRAEAGRWPLSVVVYRNGTSEGEYRNALTTERLAFENSFDELVEKREMEKKPALLIVVIQRNNSYRIVPTNPNANDRPVNQNIQAGTVCDRAILDPTRTEFILIGCKTIQGTARPSRCTVIHDTHMPRIKLQELEYMTYSMCFTHGIVTSPVSVPGPLYAASDLAKRGRNNCKSAKDFVQPELEGNVKQYNFERPNNDDDGEFFNQMSADLANNLPHKYWA